MLSEEFKNRLAKALQREVLDGLCTDDLVECYQPDLEAGVFKIIRRVLDAMTGG